MSLQTGTTVRVLYRGTLDDGTEFDSNDRTNPLEFTLGQNQVLPAFEQAVLGLQPGSSVTITLAPEEAYGPHYPEALQVAPIGAFLEPPEIGCLVRLVSDDGQQLVAVIAEINEDGVVLDFNHPLAGKSLTFAIELLDVVGQEEE